MKIEIIKKKIYIKINLFIYVYNMSYKIKNYYFILNIELKLKLIIFFNEIIKLINLIY